MSQALMLKPDSKGRITLGKLAAGVSSFHVTVDKSTENIMLEPYCEIPSRMLSRHCEERGEEAIQPNKLISKEEKNAK